MHKLPQSCRTKQFVLQDFVLPILFKLLMFFDNKSAIVSFVVYIYYTNLVEQTNLEQFDILHISVGCPIL